MQCSRCSARVRPIVAFDVDGTLGDYHSHIARFAAAYLGGDPDMLLESEGYTPYDGSEPHGEWFMREFGVSRQEFRTIKLAYRQGSQKRSMPPFLGAIEVVKRVSMRAEIWVTTTRPYLRMDNIDPDTRFWLERHRVPFDYILYDESKYQELANRVDRSRVVAIIDDDPEMYDDADAVFGRNVPILYKTDSNRAVQRWAFAVNNKLLYAMINDRLIQWERKHG
jgi:FMN phosphatase YigB (HAD superfamily)